MQPQSTSGVIFRRITFEDMSDNKPKVITELHLRGIPTSMKETVVNIATNEGHTISGWMKNVIREKIKEYPENMKVRDEG